MPSLFDSITLGAIEAPNRILMAPLTRGRASPGHVPNALMAEYYTQRAGAGLIITEATGISQQGLGWPAAPGVWSEEQTEGWKQTTAGVHDAGGRIILQLWHMGRLVHPDYLDGDQPVSASATKAPGHAYAPDGSKKDYAAARALDIGEIPGIIDDYRKAAANAMAAGFDGVQIHSANGYLIDQFLRENTNLRDDDYGGSIDNRTRLLDEVARAVAAEIGADRTAVRLSPNGETQGAYDSDPDTVFGLAAEKLSDIGIAFLELREPGPDGTFGQTDQPKVSPVIRKVFKGPLVLNSDFGKAEAQADLDAGKADAITFGRPFISNPDLVERFRKDIALQGVAEDKSAWDYAPSWYMPGPQGYTDYAVAEESVAAE